MGTMVPGTRNLQGNRYQRLRKFERHQDGDTLPSNTRYTSLRARKACLELGIPANQPTQPRPPQKSDLTSSKPFVTSYCRSLRLKSKKKQGAAATVVIGRLRSDYVTVTSQLPKKPITSQNEKNSRNNEMTRTDIKGILYQTKSNDNNKRVTFNEKVEVEEFRSTSTIIEQQKNNANPKNDVRNKKAKTKITQSDVTKSSADSNARNDVTNNNEPNNNITDVMKNLSETENDESNVINNDATEVSKRNGDVMNTALQGHNKDDCVPIKNANFSTASTSDLIPVERVIEAQNPTISGPRHRIDDERTLLLIPSANSVVKVTGDTHVATENNAGKLDDNNTTSNGTDGFVGESAGYTEKENFASGDYIDRNAYNDVKEDEFGSENSDISEFAQMDYNAENIGGENTSTSKIYVRKHIKKKYGEMNNNLPVIREELNSRASVRDNVIKSDDVCKVDAVINKDTAEAKLLSREEVISKARQDARLSAMRGQIAADKAAWTCVVRYPRRVTSLPNSGSSTPSNYDVMHDVKRPGTLDLRREKSNTFPLNSGKKLTIYHHNFGQKYRGTNSPSHKLPPLLTSSTNDVSLVTQRRSRVWVPDLSVVTKGKRHKVKTKSSGIVMYDNSK